MDEFTDILPASGLLKAINNTGISVTKGKDDIDTLNNLLKTKRLRNAFPSVQLSPKAADLIKREAELTENELMQLNWLVLETAYPRQCPKNQ